MISVSTWERCVEPNPFHPRAPKEAVKLSSLKKTIFYTLLSSSWTRVASQDRTNQKVGYLDLELKGEQNIACFVFGCRRSPFPHLIQFFHLWRQICISLYYWHYDFGIVFTTFILINNRTESWQKLSTDRLIHLKEIFLLPSHFYPPIKKKQLKETNPNSLESSDIFLFLWRLSSACYNMGKKKLALFWVSNSSYPSCPSS